MELNDAQHFFSTLFDMGLVNKHRADGKFFYATIYRFSSFESEIHWICDKKMDSTVPEAVPPSNSAMICARVHAHLVR